MNKYKIKISGDDEKMRNVWKRTDMCGTLRQENVGKEVVLNGWVSKKRNLGGLIFCDLRDRTGMLLSTR